MKKTWKGISLLLAVVLTVGCFPPDTAFAGTSNVVIDRSSFEKELNNAVWSNPENDVTVKNGKLQFPKGSTKYTRLITQNTAEKSDANDNLVEVDMTQTIASMPNGGEFILAFGLGSIESLSGDAGQVEVAFIKSENMKVEVRSYETAGEAVKVAAGVATGMSMGKAVKIAVVIGNDKLINVKVNGTTVASGTCGFLPEGSVGFFQTGKCNVSISELRICSYKYDRPENADFKETFDGDAYNRNLLFSKAGSSNYTPSTMSVEKYKGNDVMYYENSGPAQIGTRYKYSNFEMTFDVPYLLRKDVENKAGKVTHAKSMWFGVSIGDDTIECGISDYAYSADVIYFDQDSTVKSFAKNHEVVAQSEKYPFFAEDEERGFSVKVSVVDAHVTVGIKWLNEKKFTTIGEYDTPDLQTPLGYLHIWACGPANMVIDNIKVTNLDKNPNLVEVGYETSKFEVPADYDYTPDLEMVYRPTTEKSNRFQWYYLLVGAGVVALLAMAVTAGVLKIKGKKQERRRKKDDEQ